MSSAKPGTMPGRPYVCLHPDDVRQGGPTIMDCPDGRSAFGESAMLTNPLEPGLPLLVVVEGENDIHFLKAISAMLHTTNPDLPDVAQLVNSRRAIFLPTGGSNLNAWVARIASLHKREFYLFDREQEPETT